MSSNEKLNVWKKIIQSMSDDQIAEMLIDITDLNHDKKVKARINQEIQPMDLSSREAAAVMKISKSKVCYMRKPDYEPPKPRPKNIVVRDLIEKILTENNFTIGRILVSRYLLRDYGISMSVRQVGRIMVENG